MSTRGKPPSLVVLSGSKPRNELIMAAVDLLLDSSGLTPSDLAAIVATRGPGSFTGLRVTLATAQGLVRALGIDGRGVPSLLAQAYRTPSPECLAVQPARRDIVYAQAFSRRSGHPEATAEPSVLGIDALVDSRLPVIAPIGLELLEGTPAAVSSLTTAEALLAAVAAEEPSGGYGPLTPIYVEPPAAVPAEPVRPSWQQSPKAS